MSMYKKTLALLDIFFLCVYVNKNRFIFNSQISASSCKSLICLATFQILVWSCSQIFALPFYGAFRLNYKNIKPNKKKSHLNMEICCKLVSMQRDTQ